VKEMGFSLADDIGGGEPETKAVADGLYEHIGPRQSAAIFDGEGRLIAENPSSSDVHAGFLLPTQFQLISLGCIQFLPLTGWAASGSATHHGRKSRQDILDRSRPTARWGGRSTENNPSGFLCGNLRGAAFRRLGGWFLARRSLAPVVDMMERARQISAETWNRDYQLPPS